MTPKSAHIPAVAEHIGYFMNMPDIMFIQEVQDNSGATDDGIVSANETLTALVTAIANVTEITYDFIDIAPVNDQDGGQPGGNIRNAYLYRSDKLTLVERPVGGPNDTAEAFIPVVGESPKLRFVSSPIPVMDIVLTTLLPSFNPGRIDPTNEIWDATRKPLVAQWQTSDGNATFFTINVHHSSKGGSSSTQGNARPPVNSPIDARTGQVETVSVTILPFSPKFEQLLTALFFPFIRNLCSLS
jgi:predicted extracellular nuclease